MNRMIGLLVIRVFILNLIITSPGQACRVARPQNNLPKKLVQFGTCQALENHINKVIAENNTIGRRSFGKGSASNRTGKKKKANRQAVVTDMSSDMFAPLALEAKAASPKEVVGTNNQVKNVDEADFVKFNGKNIFQLHRGTLKILKAWPATKMNLISSLEVDGNPREMLFNETNAVVLAEKRGKLVATVIGIVNLEKPKVITQFEVPGYYKTARLVGDTLRIVNQEPIQYGKIWSRRPVKNNPWFRSYEQGNKLNIKPSVQITGSTRHEIDTSENCRNVWVPEKASVQSLTRIISIDLTSKRYDETLAFVSADHVYSSEQNIYVAGAGYDSKGYMGGLKSAVHKFSLESEAMVQYQATGVVPGSLLNQFAMDEHNGYLRVATNGNDPKKSWKTVSKVSVLSQSGRSLNTVGETGEMAEGERLYSVRFEGDRGYVVTFRQVDPLFTLDLKDPKHPKVVGELKVPGFSTYIHSVDRNHLLTIGKDADEKTGRARGLKLSIFDVSDFAKPREVKSLLFDGDVQSEASYEHKAFGFYRQKGVLAIPASKNGKKSALLLFKVTPENVQHTGEVDMTDMFSHINSTSTVRRSFFADNVVYAIGESGVRAADLDQPQKPLSTVSYDKTMAKVSW